MSGFHSEDFVYCKILGEEISLHASKLSERRAFCVEEAYGQMLWPVKAQKDIAYSARSSDLPQPGVCLWEVMGREGEEK